jgi:hypothetical protein
MAIGVGFVALSAIGLVVAALMAIRFVNDIVDAIRRWRGREPR